MKRISFFWVLAIALSFAFVNDDFVDYTREIKNTKAQFDMLAIKGGEFMMGSPENEAFRRKDEGPQRRIVISDFWMAKYETTWDLYLIYQNKELETDQTKAIDAVSRPTKPYVEMSFGQGKNGGYPVCNVTQYAARMFCKWLYQKTGEFYRLPTEAEWEYAAKCGTNTAWDFGNEEEKLKEYAWYYQNSNGAYKKIGEKKPNRWGLYDMYGNVAEWTSDQYYSDMYLDLKDGDTDPTQEAFLLYAHTIKGGHWDDDPEATRSSARSASSPRLKQRDPQIPKSDWWLTDAPQLGFRIVRPFKKPSEAAIEAYYAAPPKDK